ncbi:Lacal_2735 family protein [uncultured Planktosalinus sp.]|uniref:Lacal_2735 family protein n=1 Tax=uncultured Planktosalinus sp. TaxID=1810935 RepID=UPI0030D86ECC
MFKLFKKKSQVEVLQEKYRKLLKESFDLSKTNRSASDKKQVEAQAILKKIDSIKVQNEK